MSTETIAAIATPLGEGGLAVIRVSGRDALAVADRCFRPAGKQPRPSAAPSHTLLYGHILDGGRIVDEVLLAVLRAPRTMTKEDTIEISCHGGVLPTQMILDAVLTQGARLAEPGEFTKRAFLNGRIDLAQAEAVVDLIRARTELALAAANEQLAGKLSARIDRLRDDLMNILAHVEAHIDFPDEDIAPETHQGLCRRLETALHFVDQILQTAPEGQILRRGLRAAIVGRPNAGKSSLLNHLLGHERAIVSPIPGTTRDTIEETANLRGVPVVFVDTAGLRDAQDAIEVEGVRRSRKAVREAELVLHVLDGSEPLTEADREYLENFGTRRRLLILNKADLPQRMLLPKDHGEAEQVAVSCLTGIGIEELKDRIKLLVWKGEGEMLQVMINSRHQNALRRGKEAMERTLEALRTGLTLELAALDLRIAVQAVGEIVGKTTTDDLLDTIFRQFCLGK